ncbi:MAG: RNA polymerase sporulation sigma factor SigK [Clostridia bacterium]|nr:RNA polymerase sporulation sigma factor SigK [Clostridia bacterium]
MLLSAIFNLLSKIFLFTGKISNKTAFSKPLSDDEEKECFFLIKQGDKEAEEKLIKHNLRLVAHIVKKYSNTQYDQDELISVGSIGLMKAVKSYNTEKGHTFSTYAARCIQNEILMLFRSQKKYYNEISIEEKIGTDKDGNEISLIDILQDSKTNIESQTETKLLFEKLIRYMDKVLSKREKEIIYLRYGIDSPMCLTQNEVAKILNISRSYISRIEKKAIETLRNFTSEY